MVNKLTSTLIFTMILSSCSDTSKSNLNNKKPESVHFQKELNTIVQPTEIAKRFLDKRRESNSQVKVLIEDGMPFFRYWQHPEKNRYLFHPMAFGRYLKNYEGDFDIFLSKALEFSTELPNGGVTWFYPLEYKLSRMTGTQYKYSAISQGEILGGIISQNLKHNRKYDKVVEKIARGMLLDSRDGGVFLDRVAFLEMPIYNGAPEIILNGWLHALLHFQDYVILHPNDNDAWLAYTSNLDYLANTLSRFDSPSHNLSKYSDLTPYTIKINQLSPETPLKVVYTSNDKKLKNLVFTLQDTENNKFSRYDTQKLSKNTARISISGSYKTTLLSESPFSISINEGVYSPKKATPPRAKSWKTIKSKTKDNKSHTILLSEQSNQAFNGYPTNFLKPLKSKKERGNYYHIHHIVSLLYIYQNHKRFLTHRSDENKEELLKWAKKWKSYVKDLRTFETYQEVLNGVNRGKATHIIEKWKELELLIK